MPLPLPLPGGAITSFQAARQTLPDDVRVLSSLGVALGQANRWRESRQFYEASLKVDPNNGLVLNNLAYGMTEHDEDLDQALSLAQRAKQLRPTSPDISDTLGWIYLKKDLADNALDIFRDLVSKQPNHPTFRYHLAMALLQKGRQGSSEGRIEQVPAIEPEPGRKAEDSGFAEPPIAPKFAWPGTPAWREPGNACRPRLRSPRRYGGIPGWDWAPDSR